MARDDAVSGHICRSSPDEIGKSDPNHNSKHTKMIIFTTSAVQAGKLLNYPSHINHI